MCCWGAACKNKSGISFFENLEIGSLKSVQIGNWSFGDVEMTKWKF